MFSLKHEGSIDQFLKFIRKTEQKIAPNMQEQCICKGGRAIGSPQLGIDHEERLWRCFSALRTPWRTPASRGGGAWPESAAAAQTLNGWRRRACVKYARRGSAGDWRRARRDGGGGAGRVRVWMMAGGGRTAAYRRNGGNERLIRVSRGETTANRYDKRDPRFRVASDEPTTRKSECRSNCRNASAPW
jgi:hypothetical protein